MSRMYAIMDNLYEFYKFDNNMCQFMLKMLWAMI